MLREGGARAGWLGCPRQESLALLSGPRGLRHRAPQDNITRIPSSFGEASMAFKGFREWGITAPT